METYIVRIRRCQEEAESPASVGIVEDAESGKKRKFAGSGQLLKILRLEKACTDKKSKQQNVHVARQHKRS
jgi:hypothetical protein